MLLVRWVIAVLIIVIAGEEQHDRGSDDAYRPDSHPQELLCTLHRPNLFPAQPWVRRSAPDANCLPTDCALTLAACRHRGRFSSSAGRIVGLSRFRKVPRS
jgi:hypothetical protein